MNLIWRFIWAVLFSKYNRPANFKDETSTTFRVLPTDVDLLFHMNNGRYFSFMDLGRINFMIRCGFFKQLREHKIYPVIASEMMRFKKSIGIWKQFSLSTKLLGWDEKFFYLLQQFKNENDDIYAFGLVKACFLTKGKLLTTSDVLNIIDISENSPTLPDWVKTWVDADKDLHDTLHEKD